MTVLMSLPKLTRFPTLREQRRLTQDQWNAFLRSSTELCSIYQELSDVDFQKELTKENTLIEFLIGFADTFAGIVTDESMVYSNRLKKQCFLIMHRVWTADHSVQESLISPSLLGDFCVIYAKLSILPILVESVWDRFKLDSRSPWIKDKAVLIEHLDSKESSGLVFKEQILRRAFSVLRCSAGYARFLMTGSDFVDALVCSWQNADTMYRSKIVSIAFLSFSSLAVEKNPKFSILLDHLYILRANTEPGSAKSSLLIDLLTTTPFLKRLRSAFKLSESGRAKIMMEYLEEIVAYQPQNQKTQKVSKAKRREDLQDTILDHSEMRVHYIQRITQIQDLFPKLGSEYIARLLDHYDNNVEQITGHLLEDTLPTYLKDTSTSDVTNLSIKDSATATWQLPLRRNIFDNDNFDELDMPVDRIHIGRRESHTKLGKASKTSILAALAAINMDDDERDDTYDENDVGGTVDVSSQNSDEANLELGGSAGEALFRTWKSSPESFNRSAEAREGKIRMDLKSYTGMTDEVIEGWAIMIKRSPSALRRLEANDSISFEQQQELASTSWRANEQTHGDDEDMNTKGQEIRGPPNNRMTRGRGNERGKGGGRGRGRAKAHPIATTNDTSTQQARKRKDIGKALQANHDRKGQRAKKNARGGFSA